ncbi:hypothetical protein E4631_16230 [Hymenobacter sp. UV11]|uniref:DUF6799 domain-containing protein n=1 Tax=Hymenobacter sp. UV11 TaxID=1849735 RepID=UPI00105EEFC1|nr:DUF6799 domain-containing protein [Hymenobacter sp. UV11]TDN37880.1 hypothetical protein A8B98_01065 [Hymenobacter sp. UV11]TFZ65091.1 hypothetical protein E4631_16230 [Hymenobacter sp. UV11]
MRAFHFFAVALLGAGLLLAPHTGAAQSGGEPIRPNRNAQFVFRNGEVMQRLGTQTTPLAKNIRLPNGTKINVKSGIVEFPGGKITSLHENDYINAEGGIVFATPASAAAARGDNSVASDAKFNNYVQVGTAPTTILGDAPNEREQLLMREVELLKRKVTLLQQTHPNAPNTEAVDKQLQELDAQLKTVK